MKLFLLLAFIGFITFYIISCSDDKQENNSQQMQANSNSTFEKTDYSNYKYPNENGIGPIKELALGAIDQNLVSQGNKIFNMKCMACHKLDTRDVGPPLRNVTKKYTPVYMMNYLLNTTEMQRKDPLMQKLVAEYKIIMPDQVLTREDARALLEYFRSEEN
jgi:cytochrome c551/c552